MNQEQEQCKVCGRAKSYVQFRPNPIMLCKYGHSDDEPVEVEQPKQKHIRTTRMKLEILDAVIHGMKDVSFKSNILRNISQCEYDMDVMRVLAHEMIELANQIGDAHIKKYVGDSGKIYQSWEPVTLPYRTAGINDMVQPTSGVTCPHPTISSVTGKCVVCGVIA